MNWLKAALLVMGLAFVSPSAFAGEKEPPKCDASGKVCKEGKDCKPENCKKEEKKEEKK